MDNYFNLEKSRTTKLQRNFCGSHSIYNFMIDNQKYYLKEVPIRELVMEMFSRQIACYLGLPYLDEQVVIFNDSYALLSKSYLGDGEVSYSLASIMEEYFYESHDEDEVYDYMDMCRLNNLEDIKNALDEKYSSEVAFRLMSGIRDIFMFDLLLGESDRGLKNIEIIEGNAAVRLAPIYDTSSIYSDNGTKLGVDCYDIGCSDLEKMNKFMIKSDSYFQDRFHDFLDKLKSIEGIDFVRAVEGESIFYKLDSNLDTSSTVTITPVNNTGIYINDELKNELVENFDDKLQYLTKRNGISR